MENEWAKALDEGKDVKVEIKAIFDGESKRPSRFNVSYWYDGVKQKTPTFKNE